MAILAVSHKCPVCGREWMMPVNTKDPELKDRQKAMKDGAGICPPSATGARGRCRLAEFIAEARIVRCERCHRGLAEDYGFVVLVRYRGHRSMFYGPGRAVVTCSACGTSRAIELDCGIA